MKNDVNKKTNASSSGKVNAVELFAFPNLSNQERMLLHKQNMEEAISIVCSADAGQMIKILEIL